MRGHFTPQRTYARPSLAARGRSWRVFGGQTIFVALALLLLGAYTLQQQFADPVEARGTGLLFAAVLIAAAVTLLYCLVHPARRVRHRMIARPIPMPPRNDRVEGHGDPAAHRYVDRTRIRP